MTNHSVKTLVMAALLAVSTTAAALPAAAAEPSPSVVNVTGYAEQEVAPDTAYITIGTESTAPDAQKARTDNNLVMNQVSNAIKVLGIVSSDLKTTGYAMTPNYDTNGRKIVSYTVTNNLQIKTSNFDLIPLIIDKAGKAGANRVTGMRFTNEHVDLIRENLLKEAVHNGQRAAAAAAAAAGGQLGKIKEINVNGYSPSYENSYAAPVGLRLMKASAATDMAPIEKGTNKLSETVSLTYYIQ